MTEFVPLGKSEVLVSPLGVGVMTWGERTRTYGGTRGRDAEAGAFETSLASGVDFFDTAEMYGRGASETRFGELARGKELVVATKFAPLPGRTAGSLPRALDRSLLRMGRASVDLYQIHFHTPWMRIRPLMERLADAVEGGKTRAVGVSNFSAELMRAAHAALEGRGIPLASNQIQYSLLHREPETDGVLDTCRELGVTLIAYMPLAMGALTGKYSPQVRPQDRIRRMVAPFRGDGLEAVAPVVGRLREIGNRYGRTPGQVALRWLVEQGVVPIPGAKDARQAAENAGALTFRLTRDEVESLSEATSGWRE
ncbi:MAG TPA: aldo/keto reductase [Thermoplasmata archaeon]|nr:aldo/keto reductase [Thermoplasmata archaeon]